MNGIIEYNSVIEGSNELIEFDGKMYDGFYVSYNSYDIDIYGDVTTALVLGQMQKFYILKGDHRKQYAEIIKQGFNKCLEYYKNNIVDSHSYSDKLI